MKLKQKLIQFLTPKDTEEVKPNLFIQQTQGESIFSRLDKITKGHIEHLKFNKYRQITPVAWNGRIINWTVFWLGANPIKSTATFLLILFIAWSYVHDGQVKDKFYNQIIYNQTFVQDICDNNIKNNLTQVYSFNVTYFCESKKIVLNESNLINIGKLN